MCGCWRIRASVRRYASATGEALDRLVVDVLADQSNGVTPDQPSVSILLTTANGGREGIDIVQTAAERNERFAVVITDLGMPYVDGRKVSSEIKAAAPETSVLLLTGWGQRLVTDGDIPPHVDRVLSKPPKLRELREALARCMVGSCSDHTGRVK